VEKVKSRAREPATVFGSCMVMWRPARELHPVLRARDTPHEG
jgi:hypothetical protein